MRKLFEGLTRRRFTTFAVLGLAAFFLSAQASYTPDSRPGTSKAALQAQIGVPAGTILTYAGMTAPAGYLLAFGQSLSVSAYPNLFAAIGYTYGGSGANFSMPDLRGRAPFGKDNMGGSAANRVTAGVSGITATTLGAVGGDQAMQAHTHTTPAEVAGGVTAKTATIIQDGSQGDPTGAWAVTSNSAGSGASQNMPPAIITNYIVKT